MNILHCRPYNRETRCLCGEGIDLICPLSHITEKAFNSVRRADVAMHGLRKVVKGQRLVFLFSQASHSFWVELVG